MKNKTYFDITDYILLLKESGILAQTLEKTFNKVKRIKTITGCTIWQERDNFQDNKQAFINLLYKTRELYKETTNER
jgi:hypothetical protein